MPGNNPNIKKGNGQGGMGWKSVFIRWTYKNLRDVLGLGSRNGRYSGAKTCDSV